MDHGPVLTCTASVVSLDLYSRAVCQVLDNLELAVCRDLATRSDHFGLRVVGPDQLGGLCKDAGRPQVLPRVRVRPGEGASPIVFVGSHQQLWKAAAAAADDGGGHRGLVCQRCCQQEKKQGD